jgi:hypothetical protein
MPTTINQEEPLSAVKTEAHTLYLILNLLRLTFFLSSAGATAELFLKKGLKKIKIRKRGAGWGKLGKWVLPAH